MVETISARTAWRLVWLATLRSRNSASSMHNWHRSRVQCGMSVLGQKQAKYGFAGEAGHAETPLLRRYWRRSPMFLIPAAWRRAAALILLSM